MHQYDYVNAYILKVLQVGAGWVYRLRGAPQPAPTHVTYVT